MSVLGCLCDLDKNAEGTSSDTWLPRVATGMCLVRFFSSSERLLGGRLMKSHRLAPQTEACTSGRALMLLRRGEPGESVANGRKCHVLLCRSMGEKQACPAGRSCWCCLELVQCGLFPPQKTCRSCSETQYCVLIPYSAVIAVNGVGYSVKAGLVDPAPHHLRGLVQAPESPAFPSRCLVFSDLLGLSSAVQVSLLHWVTCRKSLSSHGTHLF